VAVPLKGMPEKAGTVLAGRELATLSGLSLGENHEALAVRRGEDGAYRLLVVSDDNFHPLQRTLLLELRWRLGDEAAAG
jgi:hypothetical protein